MQGYFATGLQLQSMFEAVVPVPEAELEVEQTLAPKRIRLQAPSERVALTLNNLGEKRIIYFIYFLTIKYY